MPEHVAETGYHQALAQYERLGIPTVVIPVILPSGERALYWESFAGLPDRLTGSHEMQAAIAAVCCQAAYEDAQTEHDATPARPHQT